MANEIGYASKAAMKKASAWGTPVAVGAGDGIEYATENLTGDITLIDDNQISGSPLPGAGAKGNEVYKGSLDGVFLQYDAKSLLMSIAMVMGSSPAPSVSGAGQLHTLTVTPDNAGLFATLVFDKQVALHEFGNFKPMGFKIEAKSNQNCVLSISGAAKKLDVASAVNTSVTFADVTYPSSRVIATFGHAQLFMNAIDDIALDVSLPSSDQLCFTEFSLSFERPMDPHVTSCTYPYIDEPVTNGFIMPTGQINFPVYTTANHVLFQGNLAKTRYKAQLVLDSGVVIGAGPETYKIIIFIPQLQFTSGFPNVGGPGKVPLNLQYKASHAAANPTGFAQSDIYITILNDIATGLLA